MTQEERELLAKDLCARIPYGVYCKVDGIEEPKKLIRIEVDEVDGVLLDFGSNEDGLPIQVYLSEVKPCLRQMSSMTSAEKSELELMGFRYENGSIINEDVTEYDDYRNHPYTLVDETKCFEVIEFLNSHHFDYMGLIEKGLAIEK